MDGLCSGDLADVTGGDLRLGTLPPLGGAWEPVHRVVTDSQIIRRGDVFWDLPRSHSEPGACIEEAFARGAVGVVTSRPLIEPWAGAFVVHVRDSHRALLDVGRWARRRCHDHVLTVTCQPSSPLPQLLALMCDSDSLASPQDLEQATLHRCGLAENDNLLASTLLESSVELALYFLHRAERSGFFVVPMNSEKIGCSSSISDLCCPHLAVINCSSCGSASETAERINPWLEALPHGGIAILVNPPPDLARSEQATEGIRVVRVGMTDNCDWRIDQVKPRETTTQLELNGERLVWSLRPDWPLAEVAAAYVASQLLGFDGDEFMEICNSLRHDTTHHDRPVHLWKAPDQAFENDHELRTEKPRVPPLVSGLRESDAALPPGLKRYAC